MTSNLERATCRHWHAKSILASAAERSIAGGTMAYLAHAHARARASFKTLLAACANHPTFNKTSHRTESANATYLRSHSPD